MLSRLAGKPGNQALPPPDQRLFLVRVGRHRQRVILPVVAAHHNQHLTGFSTGAARSSGLHADLAELKDIGVKLAIDGYGTGPGPETLNQPLTSCRDGQGPA
jgi:hypothetical protein